MVGQTEFTRALLDPERPVPDGLTDPDGAPAGKRFAVYRNNVAASLTAALETAFPVLRKLLGDAFFKAMAGIYLRAHPPRTRLLMFYGEEMPAFLAGFEPVAHLPYLPDIARLELALRQSYHAADAVPVSPDALGAMAPDVLMRTRLGLAPSLRLLSSAHPIHGIWRANTEPGAAKPQAGAEDVLILRRDLDPAVHRLAPGAAAFVAALIAGEPFGSAYDAALGTAPDFDLSATLGLLLDGGAIVSLDISDEV